MVFARRFRRFPQIFYNLILSNIFFTLSSILNASVNTISGFAGASNGALIPVKSFTIAGQTYLNGFPEIDKFTKNSYYRFLVGDKIKLLSKSYKTILETRPYNSPNIEKSFESQKAFFILKEGKMYKFKPSKKDLLELLASSGPTIEDYLKKEKVNFKSDEDLVKLFGFINSL